MGCIHLKMAKYAAASYYLTKALTYNNQIVSNWNSSETKKPRSRCILSIEPENDVHYKQHSFLLDRSPSILYNLAISLLFREKASLAFSCLQSSLQLLYHQPGLWLRLGECCIVHHLKKKRKIIRKKKQQQQLCAKQREVPPNHFLDQVGNGKSGKIFMADVETDNVREKRSPEVLSEWSVPSPSLSYGFSCLANLLRLLDSILKKCSPLGDNGEEEEEESQEYQAKTASTKAKGPNWTQWQQQQYHGHLILRVVAHVNMAWIKLQLKDPLITITHTNKARDISTRLFGKQITPQQKNILKQYAYLATIYHAEATIIIGDLNQAITVINNFMNTQWGQDPSGELEFNNDIGWELVTGMKRVVGEDGNTDSKIQQANLLKSSLFINLSVVELVKGNIRSAEEFCNKASALSPSLPNVSLVKLYISLKKGNVSAALEILSSEKLSSVLLSGLRCRPDKTLR
eukprot:TRINITY_DN6185_c0_g2_i2.p1 TRINITY_DN6185_c0_g2~~TRINITY_DN6185_c0_g2_i2.p1  ORF type:complete len:459 (-),score=105.88 TRINITY_DN6185_c0_g2_i2:555-1931(-)